MDNELTNNNKNGEGIITSRTIPVDLVGEIKRAFISYSMAVIINRALPDVRDGLKPVHRRILYSMHEQGMTADKPHKKCARIVGDVLGKYHPHGDSSIYDALVRLAQDFSTRYLLIDGHGNFGSVDGDGAAAMRYTEARMSKLAEELLRDIDKETVDYYPNFDDSLQQPVTLPSRFPNLLVNGSGGIAVGMATNIPPHNLGEIVDATVALIDDPEMDVEQLMEIVPGPDFPTGGVITGYSGIRQAYRTGRGRLRVRAKCEIEEYKGHERIIVTEIPYQVNKEAMVANIRELARDKKIEGISDCVDHSDKEGMRVTIDLMKGANANVVLNQLYKHTQMQTTFGVIMLALVDGAPKVLSLKEAIAEYIKYQFEVIMRRTRYDLEKAEKRAHILLGLLKALDHIDEVIALIRSKADTTSARIGLMETFGFTEVQAQAILDMKLQRLTGLEREKIQSEYDSLLVKIAHYKAILETPSMVYDIIKEDLLDIKARYGDARRTEITPVDDEIDLDELIQEEEMVVTLTHQGYIKRTASDSYRAQRRGGRGITGLATKEEDFVKDVFVASTHSNLLFFTTKGKVFVKKCYFIPEAGRTAKGIAIVNLLNLEPGEKVSALFPVDEFREDVYLMTVTRGGVVKKTPLSEFARIRQSGLIAVNLREGDELISALLTYGDSNIIIGTSDGMAISFNEEDVRPMGRVATGVRGITLREGDRVVDACKLAANEKVLVITEGGYGKRTPSEEYRLQTRGGIGLKSLNVTAKTGKMIGLKVVNDEEDIMLINDANVIIRMPVSEISVFGRAAQGVRVMRVAEDTKVVGIAKLPAAEVEEETEE